MTELNLPSTLPEAINELTSQLDSDIYLLSGEISRPMADSVIDAITQTKGNENACLFLTTYGGSADAAYLIAKAFKNFYKKFTVYIFGYCKSAGTLITLGADEIVMAIHSELGPLDVQILKEDELGSQTSGLDIFKTLDVINEKAFEIFEHTMLSVKHRSGGLITTRMASDIAVTMATQLLAPVMAQVDPSKLGEMQRAVDIAHQYGTRLGAKQNVISRLINDYPSHGFIIDIHEAKELFENVRTANELEAIIEAMLVEELKCQYGAECVRRPHATGILLPLTFSAKQAAKSESVDEAAYENQQAEQVEAEPREEGNNATTAKPRSRKGEAENAASETKN